MARIQAAFPRAPGRGPQGAPDGTLAQSRGHPRGALAHRRRRRRRRGGRRLGQREGGRLERDGAAVALGISADGIYGPQTRAAVRRYQRNQGLAVDGIAGPATLSSLGLSGSSVQSDSGDTSTGTTDAGTALSKIAQCESGGDPTAVSPSGQYRGKYQFSRTTWAELGGSGDPAAASEAEQDRMAAKLYAARGAQPWPVCGKNV